MTLTEEIQSKIYTEEYSSSSGIDSDQDSDEFVTNTEKLLLNEFDGTTVLCRVCGDKASGFHYGVHSCEGCKGFFRRSIQQKIQYRPCTKNQSCSILRVNRNRCQYCRLKKCISVGMSRDAVRFGRVPKREKAKILAAMQQCHVVKNAERVLQSELDDLQNLTANIIQAHLSTCEFTKNKVDCLFEKGEYCKNVVQLLACPLNPTPPTHHLSTPDFSDRFSTPIRGVVEFAKKLPGFQILSQDDQVTLLKAGVFEVLLVRLATMFRHNTMLCVNGLLIERELVHQNTRFLLDSMFKFAEGFNELGLSDEIIGIFCGIVLMVGDRPGLRNTQLINKLQSYFHKSLTQLLPQQQINKLLSKIPDLRTLNTLHSEKLLAFKMEEDESPRSCPYNKSFPSPSADSGIESGACSSPARSEDQECNNGNEMPVLKRALQAPPIIDNQDLINFDESGGSLVGVQHKKFRRVTISPQPTHQQSTVQSSPQPPQTLHPAPPPPTQLYPQLASALTRPQQPSLLTSLNSAPIHQSEQYDYIHSLIMAEGSAGGATPLNLCMK